MWCSRVSDNQRTDRRLWCAALCVVAVLMAVKSADAQEVRFVDRNNLIVGVDLGIYFTGGGFDFADQGFEYQGMGFNLVRFGFSQLVTRRFRMEVAGLFGLSVIADPGYRPKDGAENEQSNIGYHWGFWLGGYYRFPVGLTLGIAGEVTFGFGEYLDTSFFRLAPSIGWEWAESLGEWFVHVRWVTGITVIHGLDELNSTPQSNLMVTGVQVVYGF
jgi:hypothetical protein